VGPQVLGHANKLAVDVRRPELGQQLIEQKLGGLFVKIAHLQGPAGRSQRPQQAPAARRAAQPVQVEAAPAQRAHSGQRLHSYRLIAEGQQANVVALPSQVMQLVIRPQLIALVKRIRKAGK
jgi:hypothetical protein